MTPAMLPAGAAIFRGRCNGAAAHQIHGRHISRYRRPRGARQKSQPPPPRTPASAGFLTTSQCSDWLHPRQQRARQQNRPCRGSIPQRKRGHSSPSGHVARLCRAFRGIPPPVYRPGRLADPRGTAPAAWSRGSAVAGGRAARRPYGALTAWARASLARADHRQLVAPPPTAPPPAFQAALVRLAPATSHSRRGHRLGQAAAAVGASTEGATNRVKECTRRGGGAGAPQGTLPPSFFCIGWVKQKRVVYSATPNGSPTARAHSHGKSPPNARGPSPRRFPTQLVPNAAHPALGTRHQ